MFENRVKLPPIVVRNAVAVQRDQRSVDQHYKQNSLRMKLPPQLSTPCAWTVHPHEGGLACVPWLLELGGWAQYPQDRAPYLRAAKRFPKTWPKARGQ